MTYSSSVGAGDAFTLVATAKPAALNDEDSITSSECCASTGAVAATIVFRVQSSTAPGSTIGDALTLFVDDMVSTANVKKACVRWLFGIVRVGGTDECTIDDRTHNIGFGCPHRWMTSPGRFTARQALRQQAPYRWRQLPTWAYLRTARAMAALRSW